MTSTRSMGRFAAIPHESFVGAIPSLGVFDGADPLGFEGGDANLYRYVGNDPTDETDPDGLQAHPLSKPNDTNAIDSGRWKALILPIVSPHLLPDMPIGKIPFSTYFENATIRMSGFTRYTLAQGPSFTSPARAACPTDSSVVN